MRSCFNLSLLLARENFRSVSTHRPIAIRPFVDHAHRNDRHAALELSRPVNLLPLLELQISPESSSGRSKVSAPWPAQGSRSSSSPVVSTFGRLAEGGESSHRREGRYAVASEDVGREEATRPRRRRAGWQMTVSRAWLGERRTGTHLLRTLGVGHAGAASLPFMAAPRVALPLGGRAGPAPRRAQVRTDSPPTSDEPAPVSSSEVGVGRGGLTIWTDSPRHGDLLAGCEQGRGA